MEQRVTVIISNKDYGRWLPASIDSAASQTHRDLQIAVVDDGSTDGSADVVYSHLKNPRAYTGPDGIEGVEGTWKDTDTPLLLVASSPPRGPSAARNVAIRCAWEWSDWFQILDADDEMHREKVARLLAVTADDVGFVYADYDNVDEAGVAVRMYKEPFSRRRLLQECIVHSGSLVSKKCLAKVGLYDENLRCAEDYDLWLRISECSRGVHVPDCLTRVRVGSHNSTATVPSETWQKCWKRVAEKTRSRGVGLGRLSGG